VVFNGDLNQDEATIKGFEAAYQQFFDQWPGLFGNLGVQANYTYIDATTNPPEPNVAEGDPNFGFLRCASLITGVLSISVHIVIL